MKNVIARGHGRRRGFTLVELMVVILIIAILAALVVPKIVGRQGDAKIAAAKSDIRTFSNSLETFKLDCDRYPTQEEGLDALITQPSDLAGKWRGYLNKSSIPVDPWGNPYQYEVNGSTYKITSFGADGVQGGEGENADISSDD